VRPIRAAVPLSVALVGSLPPDAAAEERPADRVELSARRAVVEPDGRRLVLEGDVRLRCGRYRLEAEQLEVRSSDGGIDVRGPATLSLCPCEQAPVQIGFESARIEPPSDALVRSPSLRVGGTAVLALPAVWLRTPDRPGLLVPKLAWRGADGLLAGPGVHLPWRSGDGTLSALDVYISGYSSGGLEVQPSLRTPGTETVARFDRVRGDLFAVESRGATPPSAEGGAQLSWSADLSRGERGRGGQIALEQAIRRWDELRAEVSARPWPALSVSTGVEGWGLRGSQGPFALGPVARLAGAGPLGSSGVWESFSSARFLSLGDGRSAQLSSAGAVAELDGALGPAALRWRTEATATALVVGGDDATDLGGSSALRPSVPLVRSFGHGPGALVHELEPFAEAAGVASRSSGEAWRAAGRPQLLSRGHAWTALGGVRTAIGPRESDGGAEVEIAGGSIEAGEARERMRALSARLVVGSRPLGLVAEGAGTRGPQGQQGAALVARVRVGDTGSTRLLARWALRTSIDPVAARALLHASTPGPAVGWLDREGVSVGGDAFVPVGRGWELTAGSELDASGWSVLATRGGAAYVHPCSCLAASSWVGRRQGREGFDAWVALDLSPAPGR
jgi:hypothetical protein